MVGKVWIAENVYLDSLYASKSHSWPCKFIVSEAFFSMGGELVKQITH